MWPIRIGLIVAMAVLGVICYRLDVDSLTTGMIYFVALRVGWDAFTRLAQRRLNYLRALATEPPSVVMVYGPLDRLDIAVGRLKMILISVAVTVPLIVGAVVAASFITAEPKPQEVFLIFLFLFYTIQVLATGVPTRPVSINNQGEARSLELDATLYQRRAILYGLIPLLALSVHLLLRHRDQTDVRSAIAFLTLNLLYLSSIIVAGVRSRRPKEEVFGYKQLGRSASALFEGALKWSTAGTVAFALARTVKYWTHIEPVDWGSVGTYSIYGLLLGAGVGILIAGGLYVRPESARSDPS